MNNPVLLGRYELLDRVGLGGMAEVYKARLLSAHGMSKLVALKRILPYHCSDGRFVNMFLDEARIALSLNHPNIGQIYELGQIDGTFFLVMEYIDGPNLSMALKKMRATGHRFPAELALLVVSQVCAALHAAHTQLDELGQPMRIIHRDVSPHNVLVSQGGAVKLIDFGIAKARDRLVQTSTGTVRGKLLYMAPEQASSREVGAYTDLFSAGMLLLTLLYGQHIWKGLDEVEVLLTLRTWVVPDVRALCPELSPHVAAKLQTILERAMAFEPRDRYPDAEEMRADLAGLLAQMSPSLSPLRLGRFVARVMDGDMSEALPPLPEAGEATSLDDQTVAVPRGAESSDPSSPGGRLAEAGPTRRFSQDQVQAFAQAQRALQDRTDASVTAMGLDATAQHRPVGPKTTTQMEATLGRGTSTDMRVLTEDVPDDPVGQRGEEGEFGASQTVRVTLQSLLPNTTVPTPAPTMPQQAITKKEQGRGLGGVPVVLFGIAGLLLFGLLAGVLGWVLWPSDDAAEAQVTTGALIVESEPPGAEIWMDNKPLGVKTPARVGEVQVGAHVLTLRVEEQEVFRAAVDLRPGQELTVRGAYEPPDDKAPKVVADHKGASKKDDPKKADSADAGPPAVVVEDAAPVEEVVGGATLLIYSTPRAQVFLDGEALPDQADANDPLEVTALQKGKTYQVRLQATGYEPYKQNVALAEDRKELRVKLQKKVEFGSLTVTSTPWAEVYVDGKRVAASTPVRDLKLKAGPHSVTLKNPSLNAQKTFQVEIKPNENVSKQIRLQ